MKGVIEMESLQTPIIPSGENQKYKQMNLTDKKYF